MTEEELVRRAKQGDHEAFGQLIRDNEKRIYTLTLRMTGDREDALDLAQEAFLNAWRGLPAFKGDSSFATWLYRLASNACLDHLRSKKRRTQALGETLPLDDGEVAPVQIPDTAPTPEQAAEQAEVRRCLARGLAALPDHHRQVLVMRELSGLSYQEIGDTMGLDLGTVKSRLARARKALRKILLEDGNFFGRTASIQTEAKRKE